ncbi:hypothetical protein MKW92_000766 [Papaver armeniacum]|nr:hypothetical protein MKW92_000766 [Papaver armeniacum]
MEEEEQKRVLDLVKELVLRRVKNRIRKALKYAMRILGSRMTPSISIDEASMSSSKSGSGCIQNKWSVLYLLKVIYEDIRKDRKSDSRVFSHTLWFYFFTVVFVLVDESSCNSRKTLDKSRIGNGNGGVLLISKDPENIRDIVLRDFANLLKEESEIVEGCLVRDVLYFDKNLDGYVLLDSIKVPKPMRIMACKLCELGWLFNYVSESMDRSPFEDVGTYYSNNEVSEYYKLLAVLEVQSVNPIPMVSESTNSRSYLSLRRLLVWFAEPMVKMRLMVVLFDSFKALKGGAMAGDIHMHAQHGDPLVQEFMRRLLRRVCSPLFEIVRSWVLEGELDDIFSEFFVEGYRLHSVMLPSFISSSLAQRILRTGKSINFLRVCCEDQGWDDAASEVAAAVGATTRRGGLVYEETDALEALVTEAAKRIDKHFMDVIYNRYKFKDHCQGDFVQYLMDIVGPELLEPANTISSFKLYDDPDILDRLRVKMMQHDTGDRGWDVFSLEYDVHVPLNTVFSESVMARYLKNFNFLWKLRRVEHALIGSWKTMKANCISSHFLTKKDCPVKSQFDSTLRRCQVIWDEMNHFVSNLQYYIMFEVLEAGEDLDDLLAAHEKYLRSIVGKSLLGERSQTLCKTLFVLLDLILRFRSHADRLYEGIYELQARIVPPVPVDYLHLQGKNKSKPRSTKEATEFGSWAGGGRKALTQRAGEFLRNMGHELDRIANEYSATLEGFIGQLPLQQHVDLKFLLFRVPTRSLH